MSTKITIPEMRLRYQGLFDFQKIYEIIKDWCEDHDYEFMEQTTKHKVPSALGAEKEYTWYAEREVTRYIRYHIEIWIHAFDVTEVEVESKGKKKALTNGRIEYWFQKCYVEYDWQDIFGKKKGKFVQWLGGLYDKYVMKRDLEGIYVDGLVYTLYDLHALMKKELDSQAKAHEYYRMLGKR
tara:strand:- start:557 stop:1102 length:546 start_codon:yes stop_codon:yes gene_type:complete